MASRGQHDARFSNSQNDMLARSVHRLPESERDPPRGETYVALVRSDGNAAAWGLSGHLDGRYVEMLWSMLSWMGREASAKSSRKRIYDCCALAC